MKKTLLALALVAALAFGGFQLYKVLFPEQGIKVLETAKVERGDIKGVLVETGIIKPQVGALVKIGARATGTVVKMNVKIGDKVREGELIALIDDRETQKAIERLKASLQSAQNTLAQVESTYPERIKEARANAAYAQVNYERERELLKHEYTTKDAVDLARSRTVANSANARRLQEEFRTQLQIAEANVAEISAQLQEQEINLSYTRIYAPIDGVVSDITVQEGETIVAGLQVANLFTVLDPTRLEMWIYVDETDIGKVKLGQPVEYYVDTYPDRVFQGTIGKVYPEPVIRDNIVYYLAIVEVSKEDAASLKPEMTTHVRVIYQNKRDILTAPNAAIKFEEGKQIAYKVVGSNKFEKQELKTGLRGEDKTEILSGVKEGDELATKLILPIKPMP